MAYDYKQIGTSAAKVVSLLAIAGGALWWARTPSPEYSPRPQDEAEIMTACIERGTAMGRVVQFTDTQPANVSKIILSNCYTSLVFKSSILTNGLYLFRSFNGSNLFTFATNESVKFSSFDGYYYYGYFHNHPVDYSPTPGYYGLQFDLYGWLEGDITNYTQTGWNDWLGNPWGYTQAGPFTPDPSITGILSLEIRPGTRSNYTWAIPVYGYVTNNPAQTLTNTIGYSPNATHQYPDTIRADLQPRAGGSVSWCTPTNINSVCGTDFYWDQYPTNLLHSDPTYWTNLVALCPGHTYTSNWRSITNIVYTNFPPATNWIWQTNVTYQQQFFTNNFTLNTWTAGKLLSFERDTNGLYWSTNAYNDMARPLALMQLAQDTRPRTLSTIVIRWYGITACLPGDRGFGPAIPTYSSGVVTQQVFSSVTLPLYQFYGRAPATPSSDYGTWFAAGSFQAGLYTYAIGGCIWSISYVTTMTNDVPFVATNGQWWASVTNIWGNGTNPVPSYIASLQPSQTGWVSMPSAHFSAPAMGGAIGTNVYAITDADWTDCTNKFTAMVRYLFVDGWPRLYGAWVQPGYTNFPGYDGCNQIYSFSPRLNDLSCTYRWGFGSITNYSNHLPVR